MIDIAYQIITACRNRHSLMLVACISLLFCSCQTIQPAPGGGDLHVTPNPPTETPAPTNNQVGWAMPTNANPVATQAPPIAPSIVPGPQSPANPPQTQQSASPIALVGYGDHGVVGSRRAPGCSTCGSASCSGRFHQPPSLPETIGFSNIPPDAARDELLCNGGDRHTAVAVRNDWSVVGLQSGDTVAHFDTIDGKTFVEPSNDVCIYAPRFAAVRRISGVILHEQHQRSAGVELPTRIIQQAETQIATTAIQPLQPIRSMSIKGPNSFRDETRGLGLDNTDILLGLEGNLQPYQDLAIIRRGVFDDTEKPRLAASLQAAIAWSHDAKLQIVLDGMPAVELTSDVGMQEVHMYELPQGKSRLRIVKIADKQNAKPGDVVDFTIRFDNVGDQLIGNVTVIDDLSRRLEYIEDSQECSLKAEFFTQPNDGESLILRWEITDPMRVGDGGVIRFKCRVR